MKHTTILILTLTLHTLTAQLRAVTDAGDEVVLFENGTWKYVDPSVLVSGNTIAVNSKPFTKDPSSSFIVKSQRLQLGVYIDPKGWSFKKGVDGEVQEFQFEKKDGDVYGLLLTEKVEIPLETLRQVAINNARKAAPDLVLDKEEYRTVNGLKILMLQMTGTVQGIPFTYLGYYYSNPQGTVQFLTYTAKNRIAMNKGDMEKILNGLTTY